jgi:hypothetical protein
MADEALANEIGGDHVIIEPIRPSQLQEAVKIQVSDNKIMKF